MMMNVDVVEHAMQRCSARASNLLPRSSLPPDAEYLRNQIQSSNLGNSKQPSCFKKVEHLVQKLESLSSYTTQTPIRPKHTTCHPSSEESVQDSLDPQLRERRHLAMPQLDLALVQMQAQERVAQQEVLVLEPPLHLNRR
jgi:primosomal protein N''